jgi:hypothetical protein
MPRNPIPWPLVPGRTAFATPPSPRTQKTVVPTSSATHTCPSLYDPIFFSFFSSHELLCRLRIMRFLHLLKKLQSTTKLYFQRRKIFYTSSGPWCVFAATCVQNEFWLSKRRMIREELQQDSRRGCWLQVYYYPKPSESAKWRRRWRIRREGSAST